jgi:hypothetical protein
VSQTVSTRPVETDITDLLMDFLIEFRNTTELDVDTDFTVTEQQSNPLGKTVVSVNENEIDLEVEQRYGDKSHGFLLKVRASDSGNVNPEDVQTVCRKMVEAVASATEVKDSDVDRIEYL